MNTQHTFMLKKIKKIPLLSLLTWRYSQLSLAGTTPSLSRTNFHGPKGVRATEVRLYSIEKKTKKKNRKFHSCQTVCVMFC